MSTSLIRSWRVWTARARECRRPTLLVSAVKHSRARRRLLAFATGQSSRLTAAYIAEIEDDESFLHSVRTALARGTS